MATPIPTLRPLSLESEWRRIELLCRCLSRARQNKEPAAEWIAELAELQDDVNALRAAGDTWNQRATQGLSDIEMDILAAVLASEVQPAIAWHIQELHGGSNQSYPTRALLHSLFALQSADMEPLHRALQPHGPLVQRGLLRLEAEGAFQVLRPGRNAIADILGWPMEDAPPPGSMLVTRVATWDDLVLPGHRRRMLDEYLLWVRHKDKVVNEWRGQETGGPIALFSGPSGTGKTLAARVIASELGWPLFRVDLARLVSKYIGETEKNLGRLFDAAHGRKLVLLFDEVDSLMSKRGEITEARDRYANMEVSYLLARIEDHEGPCLLTTNLRRQVDKAFTRRFQMVIEFPRPDRKARRELWNRLLPQAAPKAPDIDLDFIAASVNITGGSIRNAALHAAYLAAEDGRPISMPHIALSVWRELAKERQQLRSSDLGPLRKFLPDDVDSEEGVE